MTERSTERLRVRVPPRPLDNFDEGETMSPELPKPDECTPIVSWKVQWVSKQGRMNEPIFRRSQADAIDLARLQRAAGFKTKLFRVEETEIDF